MKLLSEVTMDGFPFYVVYMQEQNYDKWFLYSKIHPSRYILTGPDRDKDSLSLYTLTHSGKMSLPYLVESVVRATATGETKVYKSSTRLDKIMRTFLDCRDYGYSKSSILIDEEVESDLCIRHQFYATEENYSIRYTTIDSMYTDLQFSANGMQLLFKQTAQVKTPRGIQYEKKLKGKNVIDLVSINQQSVESLSKIIDLSWYMNPDTGEVKKDYTSVNTIYDFESKCITPMVNTILEEHAQGIKSVISIDTEDTGFKLLMLSDENPDKDHITTIQFGWAENQGVIVYLGMEFFDNISKEYMFNRVLPLFRYYLKDEREFDYELYYDKNGNKLDTPRVVHLSRDWYESTGHNTIYDSRVSKSEGDGRPESQIFFDHDTLQMAFNLDPTATKRNKGLKKLTRFFFHEETPELSDILGKGNEGNFRYLKDRTITEIYGCADVDYSRKLFFVLKDLMLKANDKMYNSYAKLDPMMWYLSAQSEYVGMRLDMDYVAKNTERILADLDRLQSFIYTYVGAVLSTRAKLISQGKSPDDLTTEDSLNESLPDISLGRGEKFEFKLAGNELKDVMYRRLKYPVLAVSRNTGEPSVDKKAFSRLLYMKNKKKVNIMKEDLLSTDGETTLLDANKFNGYKYPLCYALQEYKSLYKEYTTYYKPFQTEDLEGRLFKSISTYNIETRRISSAAQIIKKSLKKAVLSHSPNYYLVDWDLNQVEARVFTSLSGDIKGMYKLDDYEKDYHTENASGMYNVPAFLVTKDQRKDAKSVGFGIPYGLSLYSLCERLFTEHNNVNMANTEIKMRKFERANQMEMDYLNGIRDGSIIPRDVHPDIKKFWGMAPDCPVGIVQNENGFWRYFDLSDAQGNSKDSQVKQGVIKRASGNFPIQSFAADLFRTLLRRFYNTLARHKLLDKVIFHMYIHDELLFSVHKSIDPRLIAKLCAEACMMKLSGHTTYFIGLSFGASWYECKKDCNEVPTGFLLEIRKEFDEKYANNLNEWTDDPLAVMIPLADDYKRRRTLEVIKQYVPTLGASTLNVTDLRSKFENYCARGFLYEQEPAFKVKTRINNQTGKSEKIDSDNFLSCLCSLLLHYNLGDTLILPEEDSTSPITVTNYVAERKRSEFEVIETIEDLEEDDIDDYIGDELNWSFDDSEDSSMEDELVDHVLFMYEERNDLEKEGSEVESQPQYKHITQYGTRTISIQLPKQAYLPKLRELLKKDKVASGFSVMISTPIASFSETGYYDCNWSEVDDFIESLTMTKSTSSARLSSVQIIGDNLVVKLPKHYLIKELEVQMSQYKTPSGQYCIIAETANCNMDFLPGKYSCTPDILDNIVNKLIIEKEVV